MLIASILVVRYGPHFARHSLPIAGIVLMGLSLLGLGVIGLQANLSIAPLFRLHPELTVSATSLVGVCAFAAGIAFALIVIPAQTTVQEQATDEIRGRVLTIQFTLANALGVPPLLTIGALADVFGIPTVSIALGLALLVIAAGNYLYARQLGILPPWTAVAEAFPLPGASTSTVRGNGEGGEHRAPEPRALD
jgi:hypothetical protein